MKIEELYRKHFYQLTVHADGIVKNWEGAEDIVAEVFEKVLQQRNHIEEMVDSKAYLYVMVRNRSINSLRKNKIITEGIYEVYDAFFSCEEPLENQDLQYIKGIVIKALIEQLTSIEKQLFINLFVNELKVEEILHLLNIKRNTFRSHKRRIMDKLKQITKSYHY